MTTDSIRTKTPATEAMAQVSGGPQTAIAKGAAEIEPATLFAFKECQDQFRTRLTRPVVKLIFQLTGLKLQVWWHQPLDFQTQGTMPLPCPLARPQTGPTANQPQYCGSCLQRRWKLTARPANQSRQFLGQCGVTNFYAWPLVEKLHPLTLILQAWVSSRATPPRRTRHRKNLRLGTNPAAPIVSPAAFQQAAALVRLVLRDLESSRCAQLATRGLENALRQLDHAQKETARLRGELRQRLPSLPAPPVQPGSGSHAQKLVAAMLAYLHQHGQRPVSLDELASAMHMNASYLSTLFSHTTGVTFHHFLNEVRLSKAKELLCDPRNRVGEVACATGYASADAFRHAFKAHEGLSPEAWRTGK